MRGFFSYLLIGLLTFGLVVNEASAKRFGGGRSFGVQRSYGSLFSSAKAQPMKSLGQQANKSKWGGMLGGLLIGSLLTSLFMGNGLGSGLLSWLILGSIAFFIINFLRRKMQPGFQSAQTNAFKQNPFSNRSTQFYAGNPSSSSFTTYPAGFEPEAFLRDAKVKFIRLQAAYDQKNLQDLSDFTAPEVFAEITMQLEERGNELNKTEVLNLDAQLLDVSQQADSTMASVRFTGTLKENGEQTQLDEIWHFRQFFNNTAWVVGGIQQEVYQPR
ncbi:TIM44-like domain-containing protein [Legionella sp.]|uniref:Tim44 domain-containing protein n=1 Tax=Legionella sp. TaxID=459 RepID=UPI00321FACA9